MEREFPQGSPKWTPVLAVLGAIVLAVALFLVIPLTQTLDAATKEVLTYREVVTIQPPPPTPPAPEEEKQVKQEDMPQPELQEEFQELTLNQLELSLNPGIGEALAMGLRAVEFKTEIDAAAEIERIFSFEDLPEAPRLIVKPTIEFPPTLRRKGIHEGRVELLIEIDEEGRARLLQVLAASHPQMSDTAERMVRQMRFTKPQIGGKPVKVRGRMPLTITDPD